MESALAESGVIISKDSLTEPFISIESKIPSPLPLPFIRAPRSNPGLKKISS